MALLKLLLKRLTSAVVIIVALVAVLFVLQQMSHESPVHAMLGPGASHAAIVAERARLGLNLPIWEQFLRYLGNLAHGNLGISYRTRTPVSGLLVQGFPATAELALFALLIALVLGGLLGVSTALGWPGSGVLRVVMVAAGSTPTFLVAIFGLVVLYKDLGLLPVGGQVAAGAVVPSGPTGLVAVDALLHGDLGLFWDAIWHLLLPALCIALVPAVSIGRMLRSSLVNALGADFARTARAKGLRERTVLVRHALRNALGPTLTMIGLQAAVMLAGVVVVEKIFSWPGVGFLMAQSIPDGDLPVIVGVTLVLGVAYVLINLMVDIAQVVIDPRQRL